MTNRKSWSLASTLGVALVVLFAFTEGVSAGQSIDQALWRKLMQKVHAEALKKQAAHKQQVHNAGLKLGSWSCVGPFRDGKFGLFSRCFARAYGPELNVTQAGRTLVDLKKTYGDGKLTWKEHPEWVDGYSHPLPIGPAPSRSETVYLYRTITCKKKLQVDAHIVAEDAIRIWLNGQKVAELGRSGSGRYRRFLGAKLPLEPGTNRLLVKITSLYGKHGFSFAMPLITRSSGFRSYGLSARLRSGENRFHPGNEPFASAGRLDANKATPLPKSRPPHYVRKDTWQETILASRKVDKKHDLWRLVAADFSDEAARREMYWERKDEIWKGILSQGRRSTISIDKLRVVALGNGNLLFNGGFEPNDKAGQVVPDVGSRCLAIRPGTSIGGWRQAPGGAVGVLYGTGHQAHGGRQSYHLGGGHGAGRVSQSFDTVAGKEYFVSFQAAGFPGDDDLQTGTISVGDLKATYRTPAGTDTATHMGWAEHGFIFKAVAAKSTLVFGSPKGKSGTITIDDVRVAPVLSSDLIVGGKAESGARRTFATKPGRTYGLTFQSSGHHDPSLAQVQRGQVSAGGLDFGFTTPKATDATDLQWTPQGCVFTAVDATSTLAFGVYDNLPVLFDRYVNATLGLLELPPAARSLFAKTKNAAGVRTARSVYHRAQRYTTALAVVRGFRFDVPVAPMYDPPTLKMVEVLDKTTSPSPGGQAYLDLVTPLKTRARAALAALGSGRPGSDDTIITLTDDIEKTWSELIRSVGLIAFIKRSAIRTNAVSPYQSNGGNPSSICVFDPAKPEDPLRVVYNDPNGAVFDMNLSYDAKTIFFSARRKGVEGGWHIYEIGVDGQGLKRITSGSCNDISPLELPSGEIMFVSNRAGNRLVCQAPPAGCLYVVNRDGSNVRRVSGNTLSDHTPQIMNNGQVLFTRWDYGVDKGVFARQALWTMNPDGTGFQLYFGNTIEDPNSFWEARSVPGRPEVISTFGPHHSHHAGMIGLVWNGLGPEAPRGEGFRWVTQEMQVVCDLRFPSGYQDPFPINEKLFLVSFGGDGEHRNRVYLLDDRGNKKCIYEDTKLGCWVPLQVSPRKRPPEIPVACKNPEFVYRDPVEANRKPDDHTGVLLLQDVYEGLGKHVKRGEVKALQIMEQVPKTHGHVRGGLAWDISPTIGRGTLYVRRLIGTVPVESDGSAHFRAPAIRDISCDALDAEGKVIQRMGTTIQVMPNEIRSCVGCHERRGASPKQGRRSLAAKRAPSIPQRPDWGTNGIVDFVRVVQPVLDKYCAKCHSGATPDGGVDLSGDKTRYFNMAYNNLVDRDLVHHIAVQNSDYSSPVPKTIGAYASRLCRYIESKHHGPKLPLADRQRIYTWIDSNVPYYGVYHYTDDRVRGARDRWCAPKENNWFQKSFVPVFDRRCYTCHAHEVDISQSWNRVTHKTVTSKAWSNRSLMAHGFSGCDPHITLYGPANRINLTHPEWSLALTAPLSKKAGGLGLCKSKEDKPFIFKDKTDRDYQAMLKSLQKGRDYLTAHPRMDMIEELKKKNKESATLASSSWIWHPDENGAVRAPAGTRYFRRVIRTDPATLSSANITITADNSYTLWVNGQCVLKDNNWT
ncbi:MAG: DUF642 domain-containing protein, partial [Kiritimatiellia bacterium]|nr:DUF642 domain-containing protein [Kiritimatiellia bacterium]